MTPVMSGLKGDTWTLAFHHACHGQFKLTRSAKNKQSFYIRFFEKVFVLETTVASMAAFRHQISKSGIRRWLLDVPLLIPSCKPARNLKIGPRSQKVGFVSITKVFLGGFMSSNSLE